MEVRHNLLERGLKGADHKYESESTAALEPPSFEVKGD